MSKIASTGASTQRPPLGLVLYQGPSQIDAAPIVVIATGFQRPTANAKTGDMVQTWILRSDVDPFTAIHSGDDASICGACPLRGFLDDTTAEHATVNRNRSCYVSIHQAPRAVFAAYQRGRYEPFDATRHMGLFRGRMLRLGSYGDPVAAPYGIWSPLCRAAAGRTGYTHQWRTRRFWRFRRLLMASCETLDDVMLAWSRGWRTFRTAAKGSQPVGGEFSCPASIEQDHRLTCEQCGACDGANRNPHRASVMIWAHGSPATLASYNRLRG